MLRLRRKRQETLARLKKISKENHENSLEERSQAEISQKGVLYPKQKKIMDSGNIQETRNNNSKLLNTLRTINLDSQENVTYFDEKNNKENTKIVDMKAYEENTNNPLPVIQTYRTSSYSLTNLPLFQRTFLPNNFVFAIARNVNSPVQSDPSPVLIDLRSYDRSADRTGPVLSDRGPIEWSYKKNFFFLP